MVQACTITVTITLIMLHARICNRIKITKGPTSRYKETIVQPTTSMKATLAGSPKPSPQDPSLRSLRRPVPQSLVRSPGLLGILERKKLIHLGFTVYGCIFWEEVRVLPEFLNLKFFL
jgi:hypothetical protein